MSRLLDSWYGKASIQWWLAPFAALFAVVSWLRRLLYNKGILKSKKPNCAVVVVGNISVGGNGKTPTVITLAESMVKHGYRVGILSRGYGGTKRVFPHLVSAEDSANTVGDEPALMARRTGLPVVIDPVRYRGAEYLVNACDCDLVICDDGLQHYALKRDVEIVVMDDRKWGNGYLMPLGPLREGRWRLEKVDAIIHNVKASHENTNSVASIKTKQFTMNLKSGVLCNVVDSKRTLDFNNVKQPVCALAGIGNPQRFFDQLSALSLELDSAIPFPDHHDFTADDVPAGMTIMTEKDAVKIEAFAHDNCWYLPVDADITADFYQIVTDKLNRLGYTPKGE